MKQVDFRYSLIAQDGNARAGIFETPHGLIQTPVFAPVGTQATVKAVTPDQLLAIDASLVLANTYHLYLRPGAEVVAQMGGLHKFMNWQRPILTDSGGFQVFSLSALRKIDEEGVTFKSHIDGSLHRFTPEHSIAVQELLGADIIMAFDECAPPNEREISRQAMDRTHHWVERCLAAKTRPDQALFGIVQGGIFEDFRLESAGFLSSLDLPGYAIGGLSVGEGKDDMYRMVALTAAALPADKPRYLMGVGAPEDIIHNIWRGIDIFDCVLPTRLARHQAALTFRGRLNLLNAGFARDDSPIEKGCDCYTCTYFSRAYLRHLLVAKEILAATLISIHNINMLLRLVRGARQAIIEKTFAAYAQDFLGGYTSQGKLVDFNIPS